MNENFYYFIIGLGLYFLCIILRVLMNYCTCSCPCPTRTRIIIRDDLREIENEQVRNEHVILLTEVERKEDLEDMCSICYVPFEDKKTIKTECGHIYHKECLLQWLGSNQNQRRKCPLCLTSLSM